MEKWEYIVPALIALIFIPMVVFLLYGMFVLFPVALYNDAYCLRNGYPKANVTIGLERYCMTMDGAVTIKVEHVGK